MTGILALTVQALIYFGVMSVVFRYRAIIGIGVFFSVFGVMHFLETYLAAVFFIPLPFGLVSPGSTVMFAGKLAMFLLLYIKEDAETVRQPIYGLLIGNFLMILLALVLRLYGEVAVLPGYNPDLRFIDDIGLLMVWGTFLLFIDMIALILIYEKLGQSISTTIPGRVFISLAIVLTFDQIFFYVGLRLVSGVPVSAFYGGWGAKVGAALLYSILIAVYLGYLDIGQEAAPAKRASDIFDKLTYRHRYETLLGKIGKDGLTGLMDRGQFEVIAPRLLDAAADSTSQLSLLIVDIDHFKSINDRYGHPAGDQVIRYIAARVAALTRDEDRLFRYGGEEFALFCPVPYENALILGERIRRAVSDEPPEILAEPVTISVGVATFPSQAANLAELISSADQALYRAKAAGRNRVAGAAGSN